MPKLFSINIEVEELAVGKVMRQLNAMPGVAKLNLNLDRQHKPSKPNGQVHGSKGKPRPGFEQTGSEVVCKALFNKPPLTRRELGEFFAANGRSASSIASVLHLMQKAGELQLVDGSYSLTTKMRDRLRHRVKK